MIIDLGSDSILLGYPFLAANNPQINWSNGTFEGQVTASTEEEEHWTPMQQPRRKLRFHKSDNIVRKVTKATKLAIQERRSPKDLDNQVQKQKDKLTEWQKHWRDMWNRNGEEEHWYTHPNRAWKQEDEETKWRLLIPEEYHRYSKVFSPTAAMRFPDSRPWDHEIELLPDAPPTLDCKVYPLSYGEQITLEEFLKEHLSKGYIRRSNSPYASPFFFVKKKDGKLRPVQDYCQLNKWTVRNTYPLPLIKELIIRLSKKKWFTKFDV